MKIFYHTFKKMKLVLSYVRIVELSKSIDSISMKIILIYLLNEEIASGCYHRFCMEK